MGDLEKRLGRLEGALAPERGGPCRECGGIIPYVIREGAKPPTRSGSRATRAAGRRACGS